MPRALGLEVEILTASSAQEIDQAFVVLTERRAGALVVGADPFFYHRLDQLAALALRHGIPATFPLREFPAAGGLMSYVISGGQLMRTGTIEHPTPTEV